MKGDFPQVNEVITVDGHRFKVLSVTNRRISKILFIPGEEHLPTEGETDSSEEKA